MCNEIQGGESALCTDRKMEKCVLCLRDSLIESFDESKLDQSNLNMKTKTNSYALPQSGLSLSEYALAVSKCQVVCNGTVVDTNRVQLIEDNDHQKDDSNLCIIYTGDNCRVFFTYRYSDAIYVNRKVNYYWEFILLLFF